MRNPKHYGILSFPSSQAAGQSEIDLDEAHFDCRLIPIPPQLSAGCGLALQFDLNEVQDLLDVVDKKGIEYSGIYEVTILENRRKIVSPLKGGARTDGSLF